MMLSWCGALFLVVVLMVTEIKAATPYVCYASDQDPYLQFGTKTAYEFSSSRQQGRGDQRGIPGCRPMQVWMVARHGTRNPNAQEIERFAQVNKLRDEIIRNYQETKTSKMCAMDLTNLQNWNMNWNTEDEDQLSQQGREDMSLLAKRIRTRFNDLFNRPYSEQNFIFRHTNADRTKTSAEAFGEGLFPGTPVRATAPPENDTLLRSYSRCPAWQDSVDENPQTLKQMDDFLAIPEFETMASDISLRLGFKYNLALDVLLYAYDLCRYEKANKIRATSPWCALFTTDELKMIEYAEDLKYYYNSGYGNSLNLKVGCTLLKDMMYRFRRVAVGATEPAGVFYFTTQTSLLTLLSRMDIANDPTPLTSGGYQSQSKRMWKTSALSPFGANLMAVFHNCSLPRGGSEFKVAFYLQETLIPIKGCEVGLCSWNVLKDKYMQLAEDCNIGRVCAGEDGASQIQLSMVALIISFFVLYMQGK